MASGHTVTAFDDDLNTLKDTIAEMAGLAEQELAQALSALGERDGEGAASAADADDAINQRERAIDELAIRIIATRQPMANDLRAIIAGLRTANDLERIGDQAKNIANRALTLSQMPPTGMESAVLQLGSLVRDMLRDVIDAFMVLDEAKAQAVRARDEEIDIAHTELFREILGINAADATKASACTHLSLVARSLERIGDHVTNIAEDILFIVHGTIPLDDRTKADESFFVTHES